MIWSWNISNHCTKDIDLKLFISNIISFIFHNVRGLRSSKQQITMDAIIYIMEGKVSQLVWFKEQGTILFTVFKNKTNICKRVQKGIAIILLPDLPNIYKESGFLSPVIPSFDDNIEYVRLIGINLSIQIKYGKGNLQKVT